MSVVTLTMPASAPNAAAPATLRNLQRFSPQSQAKHLIGIQQRQQQRRRFDHEQPGNKNVNRADRKQGQCWNRPRPAHARPTQDRGERQEAQKISSHRNRTPCLQERNREPPGQSCNDPLIKRKLKRDRPGRPQHRRLVAETGSSGKDALRADRGLGLPKAVKIKQGVVKTHARGVQTEPQAQQSEQA